jgi:hypothetical protein
MPAPRTPPSVGNEADRLERAMNSLRPKLSIDQEIAVWDTWQDHGALAAEHVLMAMKEARSPMLLRQKAAAPDNAIDREVESLRQMATEAARSGPDDAIAADIQQFSVALGKKYGVGMASAGGVLTDSGPQSKTKTTKPTLKDIINNALDHAAREGIH